MFKLGIILMLYNLVAGSLLAFVYIKTLPIIEANKAAATEDTVMLEVLPGMDGGFEKQGAETDFTYWIGYRDARRAKPGDYIFIAREKGYSSTIETMIGVDIKGKITGIKVLSQQETPGLGDKIEEIRPGEFSPWFLQQFIGKSASENLAVTKDGGEIDAITGATISSRAVSVSIIKGLNKLMPIISGGNFVAKEIPLPKEEEQEEKESPLVLAERRSPRFCPICRAVTR